MAEPALAPGQYSIGPPGGPAVVYGAGTQNLVNLTAIDTGTMNVQDTAIVGQDGTQFGVDTLAGMVITQTGYARVPGQPAQAMDAYAALSGAWNNPSVRLANNAVQILRAYYPGSVVVRRAYGRGRKIMPTMGQAFNGLVPWTAQFQAADGIWYEEVLSAVTLTMTPSYTGGMTPPITPPLQLSSQINFQQGAIVNTGPQPAWPWITFTGPITNPSVTFLNTPVFIGYTGVLRPGDSLVIDTRPWARTALLNGVSAAGSLSGVPMISMQLPPGTTTAKMNGQDFTGTATCVINWRSATLAIGGSL